LLDNTNARSALDLVRKSQLWRAACRHDNTKASTAQSVNAALQDIIVHAEEVHACKHDKAIAHKHAVDTVAPPEIFGARCVQA
jgi:hypothetical protein